MLKARHKYFSSAIPIISVQVFDFKDFLMLRILSCFWLLFSFFPLQQGKLSFNRHFLCGKKLSIIWPFEQYQCAQQQHDAPKLLTALIEETESIQNKAMFIAWGALGCSHTAVRWVLSVSIETLTVFVTALRVKEHYSQ